MSLEPLSPSMALVQAKQALRKRIRQTLGGLSQETITAQTSACVKSLLELPEYRQSKVVSLYLSMPAGEVSTHEIVHDAFRHDKAVFVPFTYKLSRPREHWPASIMDMLELESLDTYETLKPDKWGIPSLDRASIPRIRNCFGGRGKSEGDGDGGAHEDELDVIVVPGLAFDRALDRLGHGKGYYDFFLQRHLWHTQKAKQKMPFLVGLALEEQLLPPGELVPKDVTDYRLDALILGSGEVLRIRG